MKKGFTLIELLIVTVIVGVLMAIAVPKFYVALERGRSAEGFNYVQQVADDLNAYYMAHGGYPNGDDLKPYRKNGSNFKNYPILKNFKRYPNENSWLVWKDENRMEIQLGREGFYTFTGFLHSGNLVGLTCSHKEGYGTAADARRYCQALGFGEGESGGIYEIAIAPKFYEDFK